MRTCKIILISLIFSILMYFISINCIFYIPSPYGGAVWLTYVLGVLVAIISGLIMALVSERLLPQTYKTILERKLFNLKKMFNKGIITQEEYESKRKSLIEKY